MKQSTKQWLKPLVWFLLLSWGVGGLSAFLTRNEMDIYTRLNQPALAPPSWVFPVVWSILFTLMGISAWLVYLRPRTEAREGALTAFGLQLLVNFAWTLIFFNAHAYWAAFWWLLLLWALIVAMIFLMCKVRPLAAWLQVPYLLWVSFAGYLTLRIAQLN